jgi:hypothetical protein
MPFDTHLIAISWSFGKYSVSSQTSGIVNEQKLKQSGRLSDVSEPNSGYRDFAAILSREEFLDFGADSSTSKWFGDLPTEVHFILVHLAEWESGLGD